MTWALSEKLNLLKSFSRPIKIRSYYIHSTMILCNDCGISWLPHGKLPHTCNVWKPDRYGQALQVLQIWTTQTEVINCYKLLAIVPIVQCTDRPTTRHNVKTELLSNFKMCLQLNYIKTWCRPTRKDLSVISLENGESN